MISSLPVHGIRANPRRKTSPRRRRAISFAGICIVLAIALGVFFRCYHLERKVYWEDEIYTSLHVLGTTEGDLVRDAGSYVDAAALRAVLHPMPPLHTSIADTVHAIAVEDPQHPPAYYIAGHLWVQLFGDSIGAIRALSVGIGIIALPCMYWLCIELFASAFAARIGVALLAISPIAVLFSQEAREYMAWMLATIVTSAVFLRALRRGSVQAWTLYALTVAVNLYVFPVAAGLVAANLVTAALAGGTLRALVATAIASLAGVAAFVPWLSILAANIHKIDRAIGLTTVVHTSKLDALKAFVALFKIDVFDIGLSGRHAIGAGLSLVTLGIVAAAFISLVHSAPRRSATFIVSMTLFSALPFLAADLVLGQRTSENPRYFMPLYLGIDAALVYFFARLLAPARQSTRKRRAAALALFAGFIAVRAVSCAISANADTWWSKYGERSIAIAAAINAADRPLVVSTEYLERPLSLSNYLAPGVAMQLRPGCYLCATPDRDPLDFAALGQWPATGAVFVLGSSNATKAAVDEALSATRPGRRARCIEDQLDEEHGCTDPVLRLWPSEP